MATADVSSRTAAGGGLLTQEQLTRYSRQIILSEVGIENQRKLLDSKVLVVGAGGLGSPSSIYLAAAGVGTIGIIDADRVDLSNLHRQVLHFNRDVNRPKTQSAKEHLEALNPDVRVIEHPVYLDSSNALEIIRDYDLVINGCDNFATRYLVNDACVLLKKPLIDASILRFEGQATVFLPGQGCYRCLYPEPPPPGMVPNCAQAGIIGALAGHMGTLQVIEAVKVLLGIGKPLASRMLLFDALSGEYRTVRWRRDPNCPVCGDHPTITELIDYEEFCGLPPRTQEPAGELAGPPQQVVQAKGWVREVTEVKDRVGSPDVQWLDVREPQEYKMFRIPGVKLIPMGETLDRLSELDPAKETIVVCLSGERSAKITIELRKRGFDKAYNLTGGMVAWINQKLPIERG
ncbi:MAG: molybdopterin-synthase adenylyltransferase MoeB [Clostridia bacterium]|nr:molybdenum cofactor biosynthesis protein MoeB [Bacillota bacterium]MBO2520936.1 molybdenum cofactor biosynthesis protein MoeB [Bacillota bacterium]